LLEILGQTSEITGTKTIRYRNVKGMKLIRDWANLVMLQEDYKYGPIMVALVSVWVRAVLWMRGKWARRFYGITIA
jgi:hypothetical protein